MQLLTLQNNTLLSNLKLIYSDILSITFQLVFCLLIVFLAKKKGINLLRYLAGYIFFNALAAFFNGLHHLLVNIYGLSTQIFYILSLIPNIFSWITLSIFVDKVIGEKISWFRIALLVSFGSIFFGLMLSLDSLVVQYRVQGTYSDAEWEIFYRAMGGETIRNPKLAYIGLYGIVNYVIFIPLIIAYLKEIPHITITIRKPAKYLIGLFIIMAYPMALSSFFAFYFGIHLLGPFGGIIESLMAALIYILILMIFYLYPETLYILNIKARRLIVISNKDGIPLFDQKFSHLTRSTDESLLAGLLQALMDLSQEIFDTRILHEIVIADGILIMEHTKYVTVGFLCGRSTDHLRGLLQTFVQAFCNRFEKDLERYFGNVEPFLKTSELVKEFFPTLMTI